jgi:hypothetical protein
VLLVVLLPTSQDVELERERACVACEASVYKGDLLVFLGFEGRLWHEKYVPWKSTSPAFNRRMIANTLNLPILLFEFASPQYVPPCVVHSHYATVIRVLGQWKKLWEQTFLETRSTEKKFAEQASSSLQVKGGAEDKRIMASSAQYNYVVTAHKASNVNLSVTGKLFQGY